MTNLDQYIKNQAVLELRIINREIDKLIEAGKSYRHLVADHKALVALVK